MAGRAYQCISHRLGQPELDFHDEKQLYTSFIDGIQQVRVAGTELLLGRLFDQIGFDQITDDLFCYLVLSRVCFIRVTTKCRNISCSIRPKPMWS